jgi:hypothetical protein
MLRYFLIILIVFSILGCNAKNANSILLQEDIGINSVSNERFLGKWVLNTYIEDKIFKDNLELKITDNNLEGTLTVPRVFSAKLENISLNNDLLNFEILVKEEPTPYRVKYECKIHQSNQQITGFATNSADNSLIGGFVGTRIKAIK